MLSVLIRILDKVILMSIHKIHFHDKIINISLKYPLICVFLSYWKNFLRFQKQVRISQGKRVIGVQVIEVFCTISSFMGENRYFIISNEIKGLVSVAMNMIVDKTIESGLSTTENNTKWTV